MNRIETICSNLVDWASARPRRALALAVFVALFTILPGIDAMPVTDRDEARFAQASKQMMETGDLIDIRFQDQPRWKKPVGIYWLQAASASLLDGGADADIWAYRVPSALAAFLGMILTMWGARPIAGPRGSVLSGLILGTCLLFAGEANIAKTDAALMASATAVLAGMIRLLLGSGGTGAVAVFWLGISASILLKGPIIPAIALLTFVWLWILQRSRPDFRRFRPLAGIAVTVLLVAPWLIAIWHISDGAFFAEALGRDMGAKLTSGQEKHWGPPGLYLMLVWGTFWPWAAFLPLAAMALWQRRKEPWLVLLTGWVLPFWIILEIVPTKLPHYVLPLYPALAIALAAWLTGAAASPPRWATRLNAGLVAVPGALLIGALLVLPLLLEGRVVWIILPLLAVAGIALWLAARAALAHRPLAQTGAGILAAAMLYPSVLQFGLPSLTTAFASPRMAELAEQYRACASGPLHSIGYREPSLVFLTETETDLTGPATAIPALTDDPGAMVLIEGRWRERLGEKFPEGVIRGTVAYFNYNRGKYETADLVTQDHPRWNACTD